MLLTIGMCRGRWEAASEGSVLTTRQVFASLRAEGFSVKYHRVPLHVEEAPGLSSFDRLFRLLIKHMRDDTYIIFNCQRCVSLCIELSLFT